MLLVHLPRPRASKDTLKTSSYAELAFLFTDIGMIRQCLLVCEKGWLPAFTT